MPLNDNDIALLGAFQMCREIDLDEAKGVVATWLLDNALNAQRQQDASVSVREFLAIAKFAQTLADQKDEATAKERSN